MEATKKKVRELQRDRRRTKRCFDSLYVAPLWVSYQENLGTLLRTCDAVGACMAVPRTPHYYQALEKGNTLKRGGCVHFIDQRKWLEGFDGHKIGVELAEGATPLTRLEPPSTRTCVVLGHEHNGIPESMWEHIDEFVEIPMHGCGLSLNVAVAGSLVLYKLACMI